MFNECKSKSSMCVYIYEYIDPQAKKDVFCRSLPRLSKERDMWETLSHISLEMNSWMKISHTWFSVINSCIYEEIDAFQR